MTKHIFLLFLFLGSNPAFSQFLIQGKILETKTKSPIPYANVSIANSMLGSASDEHGQFSIKIEPEFYKEKLKISSLGFNNRDLSLDSLLQLSQKEIIIFLNPYPILLEDVVVKDSKMDPSTLLKEAIAAIPRNYSQVPFNLEFYSKMELKDSLRTQYTQETIVLTFRKGYVSGASNWSKIIQKRETGESTLSPHRDKKTGKEYFAYPPWFEISLGDQIGTGQERNPVTVFNPKRFSEMNFTYGGSTVFDQDTVVIINYVKKKQDSKYKGVIYIAINNLAIIRHKLKIGNTNRDIIYKKYGAYYYPYSIQSEYRPLYNNKQLSLLQTVSLHKIITKDLEVIEQNIGWSEDVPFDKKYWDSNFPKK